MVAELVLTAWPNMLADCAKMLMPATILPMDLSETISKAKRRAGDERMPDFALAARLGISGPTFARDKRLGFSDPVALRLAEAAGEDPAIVLATARAMRERDPAVKRVLERLVKLAASAAGAAALAIGLSVQPTPAGGGEGR